MTYGRSTTPMSTQSVGTVDLSNYYTKLEAQELIKDKYTKPQTGIPLSDLDAAVQTILKKQGQSSKNESDPTVYPWAKSPIKPSYTAQEVGALPDNTPIPSKVSDLDNDAGFTNNIGTITGIMMNNASKGTSGVIDLGTVITEHQDISGKANSSDLALVATSGNYNDLINKPSFPTPVFVTITKHINGNEETYIADYTVEQLFDHNGDGRMIFANLNGEWYHLRYTYETQIQFVSVDCFDDYEVKVLCGNYNSQTNEDVWYLEYYSLEIDDKQQVMLQVESSDNLITFKENGLVLQHSQIKALLDYDPMDIKLVISEDPDYIVYHKSLINPSEGIYVFTSTQSSLGIQEITLTFNFTNNTFQLSTNDAVAVPTSRTINNKRLVSDITLTASDVGALPSNTLIPTKVSDLNNDSGFTSNVGTITEILMNGSSVGTSGIVDLGNVITSHQDLSTPIVTIATNGSVTQSLNPNTFYKFTGALTSLTLTLTAGSGLDIYAGKFTTDSTGCTLAVPATVVEGTNNPTIVGDTTYEFSILDNVLLLIEI